MLNMIKMDLRRLLCSRSFYMILGVTAALLVLMVAMVAAVSSPEKLEVLQDTGVVVVEGSSEELQEEIVGMTQLDFVHECMGSGFLLIVICIGVTLFVHSDFSSGYIKNICFASLRRRDYVLSKIVVAGVYSGIVTILGVLVSLICAFLFGLHPAASPVTQILQYAFWLWLPQWAFALMGLALTLLTRGSTLGIVMGVVSGGGLVAALLQNLCRRFGWHDLSQYLLAMVTNSQCVPVLGTGEMAMILGCSLGWAVLYAAGSLAVMERRDI